jgi:hypothetical protein
MANGSKNNHRTEAKSEPKETKTEAPREAPKELLPEKAEERLKTTRKKLVALKAKIRAAENLPNLESKIQKKKEVLKRVTEGGPATSTEDALAKAREFEKEARELMKANADKLRTYEAKKKELEEIDNRIKEARGTKGRKNSKGRTTIQVPKNINFAKSAFVRSCVRRGAIVRYNEAGEPESARFAEEPPETFVIFGEDEWEMKIGAETIFKSHYGSGSISRVDDERKLYLEKMKEVATA